MAPRPGKRKSATAAPKGRPTALATATAPTLTWSESSTISPRSLSR